MKQVLLGLALLLMSATLAMAQRAVTGKVTDDQGEPLIGATVTSWFFCRHHYGSERYVSFLCTQ